MRLIDADALLDWINKQREEVTKEQVNGTRESIFTKEVLVTMQRCISAFENKIKAQPTAYNPDEVVQQLKDRSTLSRPVGWSKSHEIVTLEDAIEIVKKAE